MEGGQVHHNKSWREANVSEDFKPEDTRWKTVNAFLVNMAIEKEMGGVRRSMCVDGTGMKDDEVQVGVSC